MDSILKNKFGQDLRDHGDLFVACGETRLRVLKYPDHPVDPV
jgi:hypothetical protein